MSGGGRHLLEGGGGSKICMLAEELVSLGGGNFVEGTRGSCKISKENLKLHNLIVKSIFRITNLNTLGALKMAINVF